MGHKTGSSLGILSAEELALILEHYDIGESCDCRPVRQGYVNAHWLLETETGCYVLKRRNPRLRNPLLIQAQHELIGHLRSRSFGAPVLVPTRTGALSLELAAETYEMQVDIPGELCDAGQTEHVVAAAKALAWYHDVVEAFDHPCYHWPRERYGSNALARKLRLIEASWDGRMSESLVPALAELKDIAGDLCARLGRLDPLPELVIHGDYHAQNLIMQGAEVAGVIDYDLAHWCPRATEVAEAVIYFTAARPGPLRHIVYSGPPNLNTAQHFLNAYLARLSLNDAEIQALPHLMGIIWLCASLDPPLQPPLSAELAPDALPEILVLARWAQAHAADIIAIGHNANGGGRPDQNSAMGTVQQQALTCRRGGERQDKD